MQDPVPTLRLPNATAYVEDRHIATAAHSLDRIMDACITLNGRLWLVRSAACMYGCELFPALSHEDNISNTGIVALFFN